MRTGVRLFDVLTISVGVVPLQEAASGEDAQYVADIDELQVLCRYEFQTRTAASQ
jgi:hypothetical protein